MKKKGWLAAGICAVLFIILILLVKKVDTAVIGNTGKEVGLSALNRLLYKETPNMTWYFVTEVLGYLALLVAAAFAVLGMVQMIQRKSLLKVDPSILALGGLYIVVLGIYALFNKVVINYRPIMLPDELAPEASFPSSHTMLAIVVLGSGMMVLPDYLTDRKLLRSVQSAGLAMMAILVFGRLLSGAHWLTDIIGGVLISAALLAAFAAVRAKIQQRISAAG